MNKPPILSDEEVISWIKENTHWGKNTIATLTPEHTREIQRDADVEWYEQSKCGHCDTPLLREGELYEKLEQARQDTAREIFEEIERNKPHQLWYAAEAPWDKDMTIFKPQKWYQSLKDKYLKK